ncbi:MAG TPA: hypothetical protein ENI62_16125 [Gammaproteobacteria bacterium]|nr:hypothetical protein [Gammaproteobacteria bacterium]
MPPGTKTIGIGHAIKPKGATKNPTKSLFGAAWRNRRKLSSTTQKTSSDGTRQANKSGKEAAGTAKSGGKKKAFSLAGLNQKTAGITGKMAGTKAKQTSDQVGETGTREVLPGQSASDSTRLIPNKRKYATYKEWKAALQENLKQQMIQATREAFGIPDNAELKSPKDIVDFVEKGQQIGVKFSPADWRAYGRGDGDKVLGDYVRKDFGIADNAGKDLSTKDLLDAIATAQGIGVESITKGFIDDYLASKAGSMSVVDFINKYKYGGNAGNRSAAGGRPGSSRSSASGTGSGHGINAVTRPDTPGVVASNGHSAPGHAESGNGLTAASTASAGSETSPSGDTANLGQGGQSSSALIGDNSTRNTTPDADVIDIDWDSQQSDTEHSQGGTIGQAAGGTGNDSSQAGLSGPFAEDATSIMENNAGNGAGVITVQSIGSNELPDTLEAGIVTSENEIDSGKGYVDQNAGVSGTGVGSGMSGPSFNAGSNESDSSQNASNDDGTEDNSSDDSSSNESDSSSGDSSSSSDGSSSDSSSSDSSSSDGSSSSDSADSSDEGMPDPLADEQNSGPIDPEGWQARHDQSTSVGQPGDATNTPVNASMLAPVAPDQLMRRGVDEVIHTTNGSSTGESPVPVTEESFPSSHDRTSIELPSNSGQIEATDSILSGQGHPRDNPGVTGDPHADNE